MNETHRIEKCMFVMDEGCYANADDVSRLIAAAYPYHGKTVVITGKHFRISGTPGNYKLTEDRNQ